VPDKEMAAMINADALDIVEETVLLGADPTKARTWWLGEVSRIANEKEVALTELTISPKDVAEIVADEVAPTVDTEEKKEDEAA
jgi:aspartyl-tRNA(Asn)/glutamyl-tRNA(Gln) amidotransferase subunit B